jgi:hypothetical protein
MQHREVLSGPQNKERIFYYIINWFVFVTETECSYCSVRTKYWTVSQLHIRIGSVNVVWWVGLVGFCKGMKTPLDSTNSYLTGYMEQSHFWEPNTHPSLPLIKFPALFRYKFHDSVHKILPQTVVLNQMIPFSAPPGPVTFVLILSPIYVCLPNGLFPSVFSPQVCIL